MSYPCCICGAVGLYHVASRNYCKAHKKNAWDDKASANKKYFPSGSGHKTYPTPVTDSFFRNITRKAKAQREAGYLNPARKPEKELGQ